MDAARLEARQGTKRAFGGTVGGIGRISGAPDDGREATAEWCALVPPPRPHHYAVVRDEARWWWDTAQGDLSAARLLLDAGQFNLCAFHAQQAAEKALKAALAARGTAHRGHACIELLETLGGIGVSVATDLEHAARRLDLHYVQSRYPNGLGGDPTRYYDHAMAQECLVQAQQLLDFARNLLPTTR
jgi:HEPN domain-containing protein